MTVYATAGAVALLVLIATVVASIVVGARADEAALRARGCTCANPRAEGHEWGCPKDAL
jgi:hypothetical protein